MVALKPIIPPLLINVVEAVKMRIVPVVYRADHTLACGCLIRAECVRHMHRALR